MDDIHDPMPAAEHQAALVAARAEGAAEAIARVRAILTCPNAAGREVAAIDMALDEETTFSAASANKMLGHMPKGASTSLAAGSPIPSLEERCAGPTMGSPFDLLPQDASNNDIAKMIRRSAGKE